MDGYGGTQEGSQPDPSQEWTAPGPEPGLQGESGYPERPDEPNCIYYLRTGFCGYGDRCRFNHPRDRASVLITARAGGEELPERVGQPICQYYTRTGTCKFGASCKYNHPKQGAGSSTHVSLNYYGYPLRLGEKECTYYMKTGQCKFGATCKFHHPQPANVQIPVQSPAPPVAPGPPPLPPSTVYPHVQAPGGPSSQQYGIFVARPPLLQSYVQSPYGPYMFSPSVYPAWTPYAAPASPVVAPSPQLPIGSGTMYGLAQLSPSATGYTGIYLPAPTVGPSSSTQKENPFPERPGQPECQHYMKTGDCKFGSSCRYHHPPELMAPKTNVVLSPLRLPLRPGAPPCTHYTQHGQCKFGAACRFDHPMGTLSYSPSASSLADMPVAPYPVGSSMGTLAPSSSSSDLRRELNLGHKSSSTRMSSSTSISGLTSSTKGGPSSLIGVHRSGQGSSSSSAEASTST